MVWRKLRVERWLLGLTLLPSCSGKTVDSSSANANETVIDASPGGLEAGAHMEAGVVWTATTLGVNDASGNATSDSAHTTGAPDSTSLPLATALPSGSAPATSEVTTTEPPDRTTDTSSWTCSAWRYNDGKCDCGCGMQDIDCAATDNVDQCEDCSGGCNPTACPGRIDSSDTTRCERVSPVEWTCNDAWYGDGSTCHCGCGLVDPDCTSGALESCDVCNVEGSCASASCPSSIAPEDNSQCWIPEDWTCSSVFFGDGTCTCGCGVLDSDCPSLDRDECVVCTGCDLEGCPGTLDPDDNRICTGAPYNWRCDERYYNDGQLCNCGCGAPDPDCPSDAVEACDACDFTGSCSVRDCPGTIDPEQNAYCRRPEPPPEWTCDYTRYGSGHTCDCGCGAPDLDCASEDIEACETCCGGYNCPGRVDESDTAICLTVPEEWSCAEWAFGDGYTCDCGCGVTDIDCETTASDVCQSCPYAGYGDGYRGCSRDGTCATIVPDDNAHCTDEAPPVWTCDPAYFSDGDACDCGCGAPDPDCNGDVTLQACDICNSPGSCSPLGCNGDTTIDPVDNSICVAG